MIDEACKICLHKIACKMTIKACKYFQEIDMRLNRWQKSTNQKRKKLS